MKCDGCSNEMTNQDIIKGVGKIFCIQCSSTSGSISYEQKYNELIMAVASKFPGETRHETALRYIRQAEHGTNGGACKESPPGESK